MADKKSLNIPDGSIEKIAKDLNESIKSFKSVSLKNHDSKTTLTAIKKSEDVVSSVSKESAEVKSRTTDEANKINKIGNEYKKMDQEQAKKNRNSK